MPLLILVFICLTMAGCVEDPPKVRRAPAWFVMSEQFTPSGFMGEGGERDLLHLYVDKCPEREPGSLGQCYSFEYRAWNRPPMDKIKVPNWFGVVWQSPPNNWGNQPGKIKTRSGGIGIQPPYPGGPPYPYQDQFVMAATTCDFVPDEWRECEYRLRTNRGKPIFEDEDGEELDELMVIGAMEWAYDIPVPERMDPQPITIHFDDIVWE